MFLIEINYTRPIEEIEAQTAAHRAFLDIHMASGLLVLTGPKVPRTGGILIARGGQTKEQLAAVLADDPFQALGGIMSGDQPSGLFTHITFHVQRCR